MIDRTPTLDNCRNKLFNYMHEGDIQPYGNITEFRTGFRMWGMDKRTGVSNLYYSDLKCIAIWRGNKAGWQNIPKDVHAKLNKNKMIQTYEKDDNYDCEYIPAAKTRKPFFRIKITTNGKETIYDSANECADKIGMTRENIYKRLASGATLEGTKFEKIPLAKGTFQ